MSTDFEARQIVVVHQTVWDQFETWCAGRGWELRQMPATEDDLPTFFIAPTPERMAEVARAHWKADRR